jgi:hypothetical protein
MVFLRLYGDCFVRAVRGLRKSPWTLALPIVYLAIATATAFLCAPLGIVGGFIVGIVADLCMSSFLYFTSQTVSGGAARIGELKQSFLEYFWPVVSFGFVIWIAYRVLGYGLAANPKGPIIMLGISGVAAVLLNAVPEVIYQKGHAGGLAIISESVSFIQRHWIEWFVPNLVLGAAMFAVTFALSMLPFQWVLVPIVDGAVAYFLATFRGHLFYILDNTSPFQLRARYRSNA